MHDSGTGLVLSATDLSHFLACRHRTALDLAVALGRRARPPRHEDPLLDILIQRGRDHEKAYVQRLASDGRSVVDLNGVGIDDRAKAIARTLDAMREGADVIVQAALGDGHWFGLADVLQRVGSPSDLGAWSYEVADTKLARETRGGTILQLGLYSELVALVQGRRPEHFHVVTPDPVTPVRTYRVDDYAAYCRLVRRQMDAAIDAGDEALAAANYPEPVEHCGVCHWYSLCRDRRLADDHLSLVAGITRVQRRELESRGVPTLSALATAGDPLPFRPRRGAPASWARVREQASAQLASRGRKVPVHRLRDLEEGMGLYRLPEPSPHDIFLDLEGDPFAVEGGREYLFGLVTVDDAGAPEYQRFWGTTDREERAAFEHVLDMIGAAWKAHDDMHVYHFAPYEPSAFKRLMGRYATRERELDALLRAGRFVDLYAIVRQSVFVGAERYSIKNLEPLYGFERVVELSEASRALRVMEQHLELGCPDLAPAEVRTKIEGYNRDDCVSTLRLRTWLEEVRAAVERSGTSVPRPVTPDGEAPAAVDERAKRVEALRARLLDGLPEARADRNDEQQGRWILAYLLDWHRREDKATWWEYFRLRDLPDDELDDEPQAVNGLEFVERVETRLSKKGKPTGSVTDRYRYPPQEMEIGRGDDLKLKTGTLGKVVAVDREERTIDVDKGPAQAANHPTAAFAHTWVNAGVLEESIRQVAERVARDGGFTVGEGSRDRAARTLLRRDPPHLRAPAAIGSASSGAAPAAPVFDATNADAAFAVRTVLALDDAAFAVQGPPGSGKTWTGARMICALVEQGRRVGVTANSHKVIRNLLDAVHEAAVETRVSVSLAHKSGDDDDATAPPHVTLAPDNARALELLQSGQADVLGGTAWLWARDEFEASVDVLFVDEAGQMSLANAIAVSRAAASVVLLGDPQQLEQPVKGSHPEGVGVSALAHLLGGHQTMPAQLGLFLPVTWRLAPAVCAFTSEVFYEGKLRSREGLESQVLSGTGNFDGSGLFVVDVPHDGNRNHSDEEVDAVAGIVATLTATGAQWTNAKGERAQMRGEDILVVAPYNAQVMRLSERLAPSGVRVGTVDKFQGQEAPVVIYSITTSRPEDAPRGMGFLYSPNRLNVATSRARCVAILVASPLVFEPECQTPRQMALANAMCRYRELAIRGP